MKRRRLINAKLTSMLTYNNMIYAVDVNFCRKGIWDFFIWAKTFELETYFDW
jgi:hypothetical protein